MPVQAPEPQNKLWDKAIIRSGYFIGAILFHLVLFLMFATWVIFKPPAPEPTATFQQIKINVAPPPPPPPPPVQPLASGAQANNAAMEPQQIVVPVAMPPSALSTTTPTDFSMNVSHDLNQTLSHMKAMPAQGSALTSGSGNDQKGLGSFYGNAPAGNGNGLVGVIYDLKQTPDGQKTNIAENSAETTDAMDPHFIDTPETQNGLEVLRHFVKAWDLGILDKYYKAPNMVSAGQLCIPIAPSVDAPKAFHVEGKIHARRWVVVYHAKVVPPESGEFRFIGFADDFMFVRIDGQSVLDASFIELGEGLNPEVNVQGPPIPGGPLLKYGKWVQMEEGHAVDVDILIGEGPGGVSGFLLMVQKQGDTSANGDYPVFQVQDGPIPDNNLIPNFSKKKMLFPIAP